MTRREWVSLRLRSLPGSTIVRGMQSPLSYRHRLITEDDLVFIRRLVADHPGASRWALSRKLCEAWNWVQANGTLRDSNRLDPPLWGAAFDRAMAAARLRGLGAVAVKDG